MYLVDEAPVRYANTFLDDVIFGLSGSQKTLNCRWLYDERGSELFEAITKVKDYYPTRTETGILRRNAEAIASFAGKGCTLVEYGAGAGLKTEIVLRALDRPAAYVPIDIADERLVETAERIKLRFPDLRVLPVEADFMADVVLPVGLEETGRMAFFPGSTIGNLGAREAAGFFDRMKEHVGPNGKAIVGVDLVKDVEMLLAAYDDLDGITADFNLNLLRRINRELGGEFDLKRFRHEARWNDREQAVEMHLVSLADQQVSVGDTSFGFRKDETIHTESSRKYTRERFTALAANVGWRVVDFWTDEQNYFGVFGLRPI